MATLVRSVIKSEALHEGPLLKRRLLAVSVLCVVASAMTLHCAGKKPTIASDDPGLRMAGGKMYYQGKLFSGKVRAHIPALLETHMTPYRYGRVHGTVTAIRDDGTIMSKRKYVLGMKHGRHLTWHRNGNPRSRARFKYGKYAGEMWTWHENGRPGNYQRYDKNGVILVAKRWRRTGQIYMNNVFLNGAEIGMPGSKVCNPTRPEKQKK